MSEQDYYPGGMVMPERNFSAYEYPFSFNGKEDDSEWLKQDYGMRIYDKRIGRFLTIDPLAIKYPSLSTYQFGSNNPISGIDLDGLEYLNANEARIEVVDGSVKIKVTNLSSVSQYRVIQMNRSSEYWKSGEIGIDLSLGILSIGRKDYPQDELGPSNSEDPAHNPSTIPVEKPIAKSTGLPDKRFKDRSVESSTVLGNRTLGVSIAIVDVINYGGTAIANNLVNNDLDQIKEQSIMLQSAIADVNTALRQGIIPEDYQNPTALGNILNVVLSGTNPSSDDKIYNIGIDVVKNVSQNYKPKHDNETPAQTMDNFKPKSIYVPVDEKQK
ncbi:MAG: hypothetical protein IPG01_09640 [Chitinophagaceae bacterium]|nr:hypothetical protein [Chitinophagaceae bacterium]